MNTTLQPHRQTDRPSAEDHDQTTGRKAPLQVAGAALAVAALAVGGVAAWRLLPGDPGATDPAAVSDPAAKDPAVKPDPHKPKSHDGAGVSSGAAPQQLASVTGDIDGDGREDTVVMTATQVPDVPDTIEIFWGTEGSEQHPLTGGGEADLLPLADLDGDGDLEIVVSAGGGESSWYDVYTFADGTVVKATVAGADPAAASLDGQQTPGWVTRFQDGRFVEFESVPEGTPVPTDTVPVHTWRLDGTAFSRSDDTTPGCWVESDGGYRLELGGC